MPVSDLVSPADVMQPYPGLRPFEPDEALKFHGRETHIAELLRRLSENRFIAVVGSSGSGKSSLVRAGLLPALYRGRLIGATSQWRICILRPGDAPMKSLAASLAERKVPSRDENAVREEIGRSSLGLLRAVRASQFAPGESLLLVVDQFEELFRFVRERKEQDGGAEARLFVSSLLEAADLSSAPVYVVLTMRSDFLGDCSQFPGLPEALNRSQYLIPRMTREQVRDAIEKPLRLVNARMSGKLVERLLNELGDDTGQLPVLQHALNRTYREFVSRGTSRGNQGEIGVDDYAAAGELKRALDLHADSLLAELKREDARLEALTELIFRCLTIMEGGRKVRRPTRLDRLYGIVGATDEESRARVRTVIVAFANPDHAMLLWSGKRLSGESVVDISHESLIEHWACLNNWVDMEAAARNLYLSAADDTSQEHRGTAARWRNLRLSEALGYLEHGPWNQAWAERAGFYKAAGFEDVKAFLTREAAAQRSEDERQARELALAKRAKEAAEAQARAERQKKRLVVLAGILGMAALGLGLVVVVDLSARANANKDIAVAQGDKALLDLRDQSVKVQALVADFGDLLKQNASQQLDLRDQISRAADPEEKKRLQSELKKLVEQEAELRKQKDNAQGTLNAESKNKTRVNSVDGLVYVFIPPGNFVMGCSPGDTECDSNEKPPHAEQIAVGFWLGQTEVTQAAWKKVNGGANPSHFKSDLLPVENVDWNQAGAYCNAIGGRLPTEKEWEYAARAGSTASRYGVLDAVAWYSDNSAGTTHPVGLKQANAWGLYDMLGNVWEWTASNYDAGDRVDRGASWQSYNRDIRTSVRWANVPSGRGNNLGFRCEAEFR
jgi:formylglycine-generating enzyme required for sulfatase activity/energy-coupling factor transporter ATP-binding protein EcfA2